MIFSDIFAPQLCTGRISLNLSNRRIELFNNTACSNSTKLRIGRTERRLTPHDDFLTGASNHCASRHSELGDNSNDIVAKAVTYILDNGFGRSEVTTRSVQNKIQALIAIKLVHRIHQTVHVVITYGNPLTGTPLQPARVITDDISVSVGRKLSDGPTPKIIKG